MGLVGKPRGQAARRESRSRAVPNIIRGWDFFDALMIQEVKHVFPVVVVEYLPDTQVSLSLPVLDDTCFCRTSNHSRSRPSHVPSVTKYVPENIGEAQHFENVTPAK